MTAPKKKDMLAVTTEGIEPEIKLAPPAPRQAQVLALHKQGLSTKDIAGQLGISTSTVAVHKRALNRKGYTITDENTRRLAHKAITKHLQGKACGEVIPTAATQLKAAEMVVDRIQPKVQHNVNLNLNKEIDRHFDLSEFRQ